MVMPVAPAYGGGYGNGWGSGFGGDWAWIIILLLAFNGGWGGFGGGYGNNMMLGYDFPWLLNGQAAINANTSSGFDHAATQSAIGDLSNAVTSGFGNVQTALCGGFAGVNATVNGAQNALAQQLYTNQISDLERSFAAQTASTAGMSAIQAQLAQCCCDNKAATADVKYTIATEACANRSTSTANTQAILDKLCQMEIDAKDDTIAQLRSQVNELSRSASQTAQTAAIMANNEAQTAALERYLAPTPVPAYVVANPNCCGTYTGCGCGVA